MLIRHADPDRDGAACAAIYAPHVIDSAVSLETVAPSAEQIAQRISRLERTYPFLVAVDAEAPAGGEPVVGFAYASPFNERAGYRWAAAASVYVDARHQRRGVGRALYTSLFDLLRRQGLWTACSGITLPNEASVALHESFGFELVGIYRRIGWKAGRWRDVGWWQLTLCAPTATDRDEPPPQPDPPPRLEDGGRSTTPPSN